ncbi:hypothetical protein Tco_1061186 [Tanacetum coccineum]
MVSKHQMKKKPVDGASRDNLEEWVTTLEAYVIKMKEQMDSLHEAIKMTTEENAKVIEAAKALVRNLSLDFKKEIEKMSQDLLSARKFVEDEIFTMHEKIDNVIKEWQSYQKKHYGGSTSSSQDQDALFLFKDRLKEWARIEIDRRNVKTLDEAIASVESIVDYSNQPRRPLAEEWTNELTFIVVPIDDYKMVLGLDFFEKSLAFRMPATKTLVIQNIGVSQVTTLKRRSKIQLLLSATQFKNAAKERGCFLATIRKSFDNETTTHPKPPRLFQKKKEWREKANETRTCLNNMEKQIKKWAENKKRRDPCYKEYAVNWKGLPEEKSSWKQKDF